MTEKTQLLLAGGKELNLEGLGIIKNSRNTGAYKYQKDVMLQHL